MSGFEPLISDVGSNHSAKCTTTTAQESIFCLNKVCDHIYQYHYSSTALHVAAENNHIECAEVLLNDGALVDALRDEAKLETALHLAAANGYCEMALLLLSKHANPNARNRNGETPLHLACKCLADTVIEVPD